MHKHHHVTEGESSPVEYLKLVSIVLSIVLISFFLNAVYGQATFTDYLRWFMGVFFLVFGTFKLIGYKMFTIMFGGYDIVAKRFKLYATLYPFIELGLGFLYIFGLVPMPRDIATIIVMGIGSIGVAQEIKKRSGIHCACLGNIIKLPLSTVSLVEDVGMGTMALVMLLLRF